MTVTKTCGTWESPITSEMLVGGAVRLGEIVTDGDDVWWAESRPDEGGRTVLVRNGIDQTDENINVRTLVHEYGGSAWTVRNETLVYSQYSDQRLYRRDKSNHSIPLTPEPEIQQGCRYADGRITNNEEWYVCVRELHNKSNEEPSNEIVAVPLDGSGQIKVLVSGPDFVSSPRLSKKGDQIAWVQWNHPNMPWDDTQLCVASLKEMTLINQKVVKSKAESFFQPEWDDQGNLYVVSDRNNWWNLFRVDQSTNDMDLIPLTNIEAEIGLPQWVFGQSRYVFVGDEIWLAYREAGIDNLATLLPDGRLEKIEIDATEIESVTNYQDGIVATVSSWKAESLVTFVNRKEIRPLSKTRDLGIDENWFPVPETFTYQTSDSEKAHALFYSPTNPEYEISEKEKPPLIVLAHGGPTAAARRQLQLSITYWTSRGFGVADVDYRGSTGYGRSFRNRLRNSWGLADVEDCVSVAKYLVEQKKVDKNKLAIKGGSAGGFTVLAALTFHDTFTAGASRYGIADLAILAKDTHKFESRYLDRLVGKWPEDEETYKQRSPIHHIEQLSTPMVILQGSEDPIVPPNQAHLMAQKLKENDIPHALIEFPDEGHGFRKAPNITKAIESELAFFSHIFDFEPFDDLQKILF
ncbi:MAG TPA: peptidase [Acidimicrobiaceae bacterium]|nr:peptidase [Acidimicrobiaceae bacterium]|tara:strand:- start:9639 stop:11546 length:1908 start_codon:yes stop_codon:yes gene_type:complete